MKTVLKRAIWHLNSVGKINSGYIGIDFSGTFTDNIKRKLKRSPSELKKSIVSLGRKSRNRICQPEKNFLEGGYLRIGSSGRKLAYGYPKTRGVRGRCELKTEYSKWLNVDVWKPKKCEGEFPSSS